MSGYLRRFLVIALASGLMAAAQAGESSCAAKLSEALGDSRESGSIDGDAAGVERGQGRVRSDVPLRPGRNEEFRRRVALVQARSQSHWATSAH